MPLDIINKYKRLSQPVKASLWFIVSNVLVKGISFFTLPIFSRLLSTEEYGVVTVYQSWIAVISIITTLTIWGGVFNVGMVKFEDRKYEMISAFQGMTFAITIGFAILSFVLLPLIQPLLKMNNLLIMCMYLEILAQIPFNLWATEQRYTYEYKKLIGVTIVLSVLNPIISVVAVLNTEYKAEARIICGMLVQFVVGIYFFIKNQYRGRKFYNKEFWKFGFLFNIVLVPHYLSMQVLNQSDRIMINNICGSSDAGIYGVAYNFALLLSLITAGINSSLTPHIYQCLKTGEEKNLKNQTTAIIAAVAVLTIGIIAFIPDMFHLLLPESYYPALKVIPPVTAGAFFLFLYPLFGAVEFYYEENRYVTIASLLGAVLNIWLNYVFIKLYGFVAAAYTTLFCYICFSLCHYIFMKKIMRQKEKNFEIYDMKKLLIISTGVTLFSLLMVSVYDVFIIRWTIIGLIVSVSIIKRKYLMEIFKSIKKENGGI